VNNVRSAVIQEAEKAILQRKRINVSSLMDRVWFNLAF
jgi:hypothetical protein